MTSPPRSVPAGSRPLFFLGKGGDHPELELLEQAIERDPGYGATLAHAAGRHYDLHVNGWTDDPEESRRRGMDLARRALQVAGDDPNVLSSAGFTLAYFGEDIDVGIAFLDRALRLNPSCAGRWQRRAG